MLFSAPDKCHTALYCDIYGHRVSCDPFTFIVADHRILHAFIYTLFFLFTRMGHRELHTEWLYLYCSALTLMAACSDYPSKFYFGNSFVALRRRKKMNKKKKQVFLLMWKRQREKNALLLFESVETVIMKPCQGIKVEKKNSANI